MNIQAISRDTFMKSPSLYCNTFTSNITNGNYDFDAMQSKLVKRVS